MSLEDVIQYYDYKSLDQVEAMTKFRHADLLAQLKKGGTLPNIAETNDKDVRRALELSDFAKCIGNGHAGGPPVTIGLQSTGTCYLYAALVAVMNCGDLSTRLQLEISNEYRGFVKNPLKKSGKQRRVNDVLMKLFDGSHTPIKKLDWFVDVMAKSEKNHLLVRNMLLFTVLRFAGFNGEGSRESLFQDGMYSLITSRFSEVCGRSSKRFLDSKDGGVPLHVIEHVVGLNEVEGYPYNFYKVFDANEHYGLAVLLAKEEYLFMNTKFNKESSDLQLLTPHTIMFDQSGVLSVYMKDSYHAVAYSRAEDEGITILDANLPYHVPLKEYPFPAFCRVSLSLSPCVADGGGQVQAAQARPAVPSRHGHANAPRPVTAARAVSRPEKDMNELYVLESLLYIMMLEPYYDQIDGTCLADEIADWIGYAQMGGASRTPWGAWAAMAAVVMAGAFF